MKIILGSQNKAKLAAVQAVFPQATRLAENVASHVSKQPLTDEETMQGAMNRAAEARMLAVDAYGIGLEGGVMLINQQLYLCNWGAIQTPTGANLTASGARIPLPDSFRKPLEDGVELSELMDRWANKTDIRHAEGAIGIFTKGEVDRAEMFIHVLRLLKGQLALLENK